MDLTTTLEALADDNRLAIVRLLANGEERCVCDVSESLGISNALASHHLKKLRAAGLVSCERRGAWLHCALDRSALGQVAEQLRALAETEVITGAAPCCGVTKEETIDV